MQQSALTAQYVSTIAQHRTPPPHWRPGQHCPSAVHAAPIGRQHCDGAVVWHASPAQHSAFELHGPLFWGTQHPPLMHVRPAPHVRPHVPQFVGFSAVFTHAPPQHVSPLQQSCVPVHDVPPAAQHRPPEHTRLLQHCPFAVHALPICTQHRAAAPPSATQRSPGQHAGPVAHAVA